MYDMFYVMFFFISPLYKKGCNCTVEVNTKTRTRTQTPLPFRKIFVNFVVVFRSRHHIFVV